MSTQNLKKLRREHANLHPRYAKRSDNSLGNTHQPPRESRGQNARRVRWLWNGVYAMLRRVGRKKGELEKKEHADLFLKFLVDFIKMSA